MHYAWVVVAITFVILLVSALLAIGVAVAPLLRERWQLVALWGLGIGVGTGLLAMVLAATVVNRWLVARRGTVLGILTASGSTGQLVFLPMLAHATARTSSPPRATTASPRCERRAFSR